MWNKAIAGWSLLRRVTFQSKEQKKIEKGKIKKTEETEIIRSL